MQQIKNRAKLQREAKITPGPGAYDVSVKREKPRQPILRRTLSRSRRVDPPKQDLIMVTVSSPFYQEKKSLPQTVAYSDLERQPRNQTILSRAQSFEQIVNFKSYQVKDKMVWHKQRSVAGGIPQLIENLNFQNRQQVDKQLQNLKSVIEVDQRDHRQSRNEKIVSRH
jgi:hypothetical protein